MQPTMKAKRSMVVIGDALVDVLVDVADHVHMGAQVVVPALVLVVVRGHVHRVVVAPVHMDAKVTAIKVQNEIIYQV